MKIRHSRYRSTGYDKTHRLQLFGELKTACPNCNELHLHGGELQFAVYGKYSFEVTHRRMLVCNDRAEVSHLLENFPRIHLDELMLFFYQ